LEEAAAVWRHCGVSGGSSAAGAVLLLHAATVVTKIPAATAKMGAQTTINNQLKAAEATATETATTTTINSLSAMDGHDHPLKN
jgi:hypothetical protein